jgi:hypothetical protein
MFTSNETGADYDHFFESFIETCTKNDVVFDPKFMFSDAARAIVNSIKKAFPDCQYLNIKILDEKLLEKLMIVF